MAGHKWAHIEDLPANWKEFASTELTSLAPIWQEQGVRLNDTGALREFNARLSREWAIETGIIEGLYSLDRGVTQLLIERGLQAELIGHGSSDKAPEEIAAILNDQHETLEGVFEFVAQRRSLSTSYIKQLHQTLTRNQHTVAAINGLGRSVEVPLLRGDWKQQPNNPTRPNGDVHEYCPPEHVASEMDQLIQLHDRHTADGVPADVEAAWLHHRFTQIHPFQDGNGRIARTLASLIFLRAGWFPLVVDRDLRGEYIESLERADQRDLATLAQLFAEIEKGSFLRALKISEDVLRPRVQVKQVIAAVGDRLRAKQNQEQEKQQKVFEIATSLNETTSRTFRGIKDDLDVELRSVDQGWQHQAVVDWSSDQNTYWFKKQIVVIAKHFDYFADTDKYASWVRLKIRHARPTELVVSFHSAGFEFVGIIAATAFLAFRDRDDEGSVTIDGPYRLNQRVFQCSFNEDEQVVERRFETWLNEVILAGLDQYRRQL